MAQVRTGCTGRVIRPSSSKTLYIITSSQHLGSTVSLQEQRVAGIGRVHRQFQVYMIPSLHMISQRRIRLEWVHIGTVVMEDRVPGCLAPSLRLLLLLQVVWRKTCLSPTLYLNPLGNRHMNLLLCLRITGTRILASQQPNTPGCIVYPLLFFCTLSLLLCGLGRMYFRGIHDHYLGRNILLHLSSLYCVFLTLHVCFFCSIFAFRIFNVFMVLFGIQYILQWT